MQFYCRRDTSDGTTFTLIDVDTLDAFGETVKSLLEESPEIVIVKVEIEGTFNPMILEYEEVHDD